MDPDPTALKNVDPDWSSDKNVDPTPEIRIGSGQDPTSEKNLDLDPISLDINWIRIRPLRKN